MGSTELPAAPFDALVSLGSNIDPERNFAWARVALELRFGHVEMRRVPSARGPARAPDAGQPRRTVTFSTTYRSPAAGGSEGQAAFLNACARFSTDLPEAALRAVLREFERAAGRRRSADRFAARPLDLDLVAIARGGDPAQVLDADLFTAPYLLVPAAEVWPDLEESGSGKRLASAAADLPEAARADLEAVSEASGG